MVRTTACSSKEEFLKNFWRIFEVFKKYYFLRIRKNWPTIKSVSRVSRNLFEFDFCRCTGIWFVWVAHWRRRVGSFFNFLLTVWVFWFESYLINSVYLNQQKKIRTTMKLANSSECSRKQQTRDVSTAGKMNICLELANFRDKREQLRSGSQEVVRRDCRQEGFGWKNLQWEICRANY